MNKEYPNLRDDANITKYNKYGKILNKELNKNSNSILINLKSNPDKDLLNKVGDKDIQNFISYPVNEKNISFLNIKNNCINIKKSDIPLPKINKVKIKRPINILQKNKNISLCNENTSRWIQKLTINNKDNYSFFNKNMLINKEENKSRNNSSNNKITIKKDSLSISNSRKYMKIPKSFLLHKNINSKFESDIISLRKNATPTASSSRIIHPILGLTKIPSHALKNSNSHKKLKKIIHSDQSKDSKERTEKLNILNNIFKTVENTTQFNFSGIIPFKKEVKLSSEIFRNNFRNFKESIISKKEDICKIDIIKGFAYNTSIGNIRSYNEDEISVTKLFFNNNDNNKDKYDINNENFCHFFAIFDGHGGKGCASFLKENLHKNIAEFSTLGMKIGIDISEQTFMSNKALSKKGKIIDPSGSCGIMLMIQGRKCIIANIGD